VRETDSEKLLARIPEEAREHAAQILRDAESARKRARTGRLRKDETADQAIELAAKLTVLVVGMATTERANEEAERKALDVLFSELPTKQKAIADRLIEQAARLRAQLDDLAEDIRKNGKTEMFRQSDKVEPYSRERPETGLYIKLQKNFFAVMAQLKELLPAEQMQESDALDAFLRDDG